MKYLYTPTEGLGFDSVSIVSLTRDDDVEPGVNVVYAKDGVETIIHISAQHILECCGEQSFKDCSTYYAVFENGGFTFINKFAETFYTKQTGIEYIRSANKVVPVQVYIPFASSTLEGATVRVSGPGVPTLDGEPLDSSLAIEANQESFTNCLWSLVPRVTAPAQSASPVTVQLTLNGTPIRKSGVSIVAKTSDGVIATSVETNEDGKAEFNAASGSVIEFGFRYYSNMASTTVL